MRSRAPASTQLAGRLRSRLRSQAAASLFQEGRDAAGPSPLAHTARSRDFASLDGSHGPASSATLKVSHSYTSPAGVQAACQRGAASNAPALQQQASTQQAPLHQDQQLSALAHTAPPRYSIKAADATASLKASMTATDQGARAARFAEEASLEPRSSPRQTARQVHASPTTTEGGATSKAGARMCGTTQHSNAAKPRASAAAVEPAQHPALLQIEKRSEWHAMSAGTSLLQA